MFALLKNCPWHAHFLRCLFQFFNIRNFQIFRITKFASQIVFYFVLIVSSVKYQSSRLFLCERMRAFTRFLFAVLVANFEFTGFNFEKYMHSLWPFPWWLLPWKRSVWQNPDQERTNQNARINFEAILPYNKMEDISWPRRDMKCIFLRVLQESVQNILQHEKEISYLQAATWCSDYYVKTNEISKHLIFAAEGAIYYVAEATSEHVIFTCNDIMFSRKSSPGILSVLYNKTK